MSYPSMPESGVKFARISATTATGTLIASVTGKKIRVLDFILSSSAQEPFDFRSGGSTILCGPVRDAATVQLTPGFNPYGHFETVAGEALQYTKSAGVIVFGGSIVYTLA